MGFDFGILLYILSESTTFRTNILTDASIPVQEYRIWEGGLPLPGICYILNSAKYLEEPELWNHRLVMCSGWLSEDVIQSSGAYLVCVSPQLSVNDLSAVFQNAVRRYYEWKIGLQAMLCRRDSLDDVLSYMEEKWKIGSCISTESMQILGRSARFTEYNDWLDQEQGVSLTLVNDLIADEDFRQAAGRQGAFCYYGMHDDWSYCYNFISGEVYSARLIASAPDHRQHYGILFLVQSLGDSMRDVYEEYLVERIDSSARKEFGDVVTRLIGNTAVRETEIRHILSACKWEGEQNFQVILFRFLPWTGGRKVGPAYYPAQIRKLFRDSQVIDMGDEFVCIRNVTDVSASTGEYQTKLPYFLRETLCKAGISNVFHNFRLLRRYYLEADNALVLGGRLDNTLWYYPFSSYVMPYILEQCTRDLAPGQLYHPAISQLQTYDAANGTHLLETLIIFLEKKQSITHTAAQLQIHRTSLLARIDRIEKLTKADLDDPLTCLHLQFSAELMKLEKT